MFKLVTIYVGVHYCSLSSLYIFEVSSMFEFICILNIREEKASI